MRKPGIFIFCLLGYIGGCFVFVNSFWRAPESGYTNLIMEKNAFFAVVESDPVAKGYDSEIVVRPEGGREKILVTAFSRNEFRYKDEVLVIGKAKVPQSSDDFDYKAYLQMQNISAQIYYPEVYIWKRQKSLIGEILQIKHLIYARIEKSFPPLQAGLMITFLAGDKQYLSKEWIEKFNSIGVAHVIAVSGYKLTLLLVWVDAIARYFGKKKTVWVPGTVAILYAVIANFSPAVMRSVIMSGMFVFAKQKGRRNNLFNSLVFTAVILLIENPLIIKYDLGFILSFLGIAGIVLYSPLINFLLNRYRIKIPHIFGIREIFVSTTAAQIATLPIMVKTFHILPLIAPVSNLLVLPLLAPIIALGYLFLIPIAGLLVKPILLVALNYTLITVGFMYSIPHSYIQTHLSNSAFASIYLIELVAYFYLLRRLKHSEFSGKMILK